MHSFLFDLRFTLRELRRRPTFTLTAILSLALGIAATSAVFSVIYAVLIDPFPYPGSDRLMEPSMLDAAGHDRYAGLNGPQLEQLRQARSVESIAGMDYWNLTTTDGDLPEDVRASYLSPDDPNHWGTKALMGRWLMPSDAPFGQDAQPVVALGYKFWQRYYLGDPNVIGRTIQLVHKPYTIVGVMPPRFKWADVDMYLPLKVTRDPHIYFGASIKLRPGITTTQANSELQPYLEQFAKESPERYPEKFRVNLRSITELYAKPLGPTLYLLLGAVASLLLIGCGNVSILLLARGTERQQELAVRAAVGADRPRMIRQLLTESLVIALAGTTLGVILAWKSLALITAWLPQNSFPAESVIKMNLPVLLFSAGLAFATAILFGLSPALQLSHPDIGRLMQSSGRRVMGSSHAKRAHRVMVAAQVALTVLLLSAASAAGKGFLRLLHADLGYDPHAAMSVPIPIHENTHVSWKDRSEYFEQIRAAIATMPEVVSAGISTNATPPDNGWDTRFEIFGSAASEKPEASVNYISPEYLEVLHIPLSQGRIWDHTETMRAAPLAVINQTMARQYWPNGDAIGHQVRIPAMKDEPPYSPAAAGADGWLQIVGVVTDVRDDGLRNPIKPAIYVPYTIQMRMFTQILVRTRVAPLSILHDIRARLVTLDREQQVMEVRDLETWITGLQEYSQQKFIATLFALFSVLALVLAAVGLYSVVSYGVATRTNEFGIRMALGARSSDVFRIVFSSTAVNVGAGLVAGILLSIAFNKISTRWVMESSRNPWILAGVALILIAAAALACFVPARRAASIDPMEALRYE
ncbi:MAG TPA: ABC transporter permease [Verrucomicrobiae bacterium]|jgi:putative ABC transport system permease protein|nr:ABC transporter permease [Verrucomicrobiae bacterium]